VHENRYLQVEALTQPGRAQLEKQKLQQRKTDQDKEEASMVLKARRAFRVQKNSRLKNEEAPLETMLAPEQEASNEETPEITCLGDYWNPRARFPIPYVKMKYHVDWVRRWNRLHRVVTNPSLGKENHSQERSGKKSVARRKQSGDG
jgi:hypothetical protein